MNPNPPLDRSQIERLVWEHRQKAVARLSEMAARGEIPCEQVMIRADIECERLRHGLWEAQRDDRWADL